MVQYAVVVWGFPRVCAGAILMWYSICSGCVGFSLGLCWCNVSVVFNVQWLCGVFPGFVLGATVQWLQCIHCCKGFPQGLFWFNGLQCGCMGSPQRLCWVYTD